MGIQCGNSKPTGEKPAVNIPTDTNKETLTKQAVESYEAAIRFQKEGNWAAYGEAIKKLGLNGINVLVF